MPSKTFTMILLHFLVTHASESTCKAWIHMMERSRGNFTLLYICLNTFWDMESYLFIDIYIFCSFIHRFHRSPLQCDARKQDETTWELKRKLLLGRCTILRPDNSNFLSSLEIISLQEILQHGALSSEQQLLVIRGSGLSNIAQQHHVSHRSIQHNASGGSSRQHMPSRRHYQTERNA